MKLRKWANTIYLFIVKVVQKYPWIRRYTYVDIDAISSLVSMPAALAATM